MRRDVPNFPVAPILRELGVDVPDIRRGYVLILCPFHPDTTKSASVREFSFKCFACDRSGDALKLVMEEMDLSFADAIDECRRLTGVEDRSVRTGSGWGDSLIPD